MGKKGGTSVTLSTIMIKNFFKKPFVSKLPRQRRGFLLSSVELILFHYLYKKYHIMRSFKVMLPIPLIETLKVQTPNYVS